MVSKTGAAAYVGATGVSTTESATRVVSTTGADANVGTMVSKTGAAAYDGAAGVSTNGSVAYVVSTSGAPLAPQYD